MIVKRGEIYLVGIPGQTKPRPAIVLTANWLSQYALDVSVIPLTSVAKRNFPTRVALPAGESGLNRASWAKCDQVTTVPKSLLVGKAFGKISPDKMTAIEEAVRLSLAL